MELSNRSKKGKIFRLLVGSYMSSVLFFIVIGVLFNFIWVWISIAIFFSSMGIHFATLNEQESLPDNEEDAGYLAGLLWVSGWIGFLLGSIIIFGTIIDSQLEILRVLAIGFFIWGIGGFIGLKRNLALLRELQGIKVTK